MALDDVGLEALEPELDRGEGGGGAGDRDRALGAQARVGGELGLQGAADIVGERLELLGLRRAGVPVALPGANADRLQRGVAPGPPAGAHD